MSGTCSCIALQLAAPRRLQRRHWHCYLVSAVTAKVPPEACAHARGVIAQAAAAALVVALVACRAAVYTGRARGGGGHRHARRQLRHRLVVLVIAADDAAPDASVSVPPLAVGFIQLRARIVAAGTPALAAVGAKVLHALRLARAVAHHPGAVAHAALYFGLIPRGGVWRAAVAGGGAEGLGVGFLTQLRQRHALAVAAARGRARARSCTDKVWETRQGKRKGFDV